MTLDLEVRVEEMLPGAALRIMAQEATVRYRALLEALGGVADEAVDSWCSLRGCTDLSVEPSSP